MVTGHLFTVGLYAVYVLVCKDVEEPDVVCTCVCKFVLNSNNN